MNWKGKKVAVTGSNGMIGKELVEQLENLGANVHQFDLNDMVRLDLRDYPLCKRLLTRLKIDYVFHLAGVKGSPKMTKERPVDFMSPMLLFDSAMITASQESKVKVFLYTSSIAVEHPESDKFPAWAKKTGETLIEAMRVQYPKGTKYCIVRPANVYGRFDNFNNPNAMVISSLIQKSLAKSTLEVWGDGTQVRDFINARDVAGAMIKTMEKMPNESINLSSGSGITIGEVAEYIAKISGKETKYIKSEFTGEKRRVMRSDLDKIGYKLKVKLLDGIKEAYDAARSNYITNKGE